MADAASRLTSLAEELLGGPLPVRLRAWDGSEAGPVGGPVLIVRDRRALRRMIWKPGELGLARAWVAGELDVEGDLYALLDGLSGLLWERDEDTRGLLASARDPRLRAAAGALLKLSGPPLPPQPPAEEMRGRSGGRHTRRREIWWLRSRPPGLRSPYRMSAYSRYRTAPTCSAMPIEEIASYGPSVTSR